jgi:hypothetical protein
MPRQRTNFALDHYELAVDEVVALVTMIYAVRCERSCSLMSS